MADISFTNPTWANGGVPALSAANLQAITDALDDVCHLANRGGAILDADTVSGYGIGVNSPPVLASFASASIGSGVYTYGASTAGAPEAYGGSVFAACDGTLDRFWALSYTSDKRYFGYRGHGSAAITWMYSWDSGNDGNGGQPPAPKPKSGTSNLIGEVFQFTITGNGNNKYVDGTETARSAGELWLAYILRIVVATNVYDGTEVAGVVAGNTIVANGSSSYKYTGFSWRVA